MIAAVLAGIVAGWLKAGVPPLVAEPIPSVGEFQQMAPPVAEPIPPPGGGEFFIQAMAPTVIAELTPIIQPIEEPVKDELIVWRGLTETQIKAMTFEELRTWAGY